MAPGCVHFLQHVDRTSAVYSPRSPHRQAYAFPRRRPCARAQRRTSGRRRRRGPLASALQPAPIARISGRTAGMQTAEHLSPSRNHSPPAPPRKGALRQILTRSVLAALRSACGLRVCPCAAASSVGLSRDARRKALSEASPQPSKQRPEMNKRDQTQRHQQEQKPAQASSKARVEPGLRR